jgi:hypothetical protein
MDDIRRSAGAQGRSSTTSSDNRQDRPDDGGSPSRLDKNGVLRARSLGPVPGPERVLKRVSKAKQAAYAVADALEAKRADLAYAIRRCASWIVLRERRDTGVHSLKSGNFCNRSLLCQPCAIWRARRAFREYYAVLMRLLVENATWRPYHMVLTVKNGVDLAERFEHLSKSVETLLKRRRLSIAGQRHASSIAGLEGGVMAFEVSRGKDGGWHPHVHMIVMGPKRPVWSELRDEWEQITKDSKIVKVLALKNCCDIWDGEGKMRDDAHNLLARDMLELFKYPLKFSSLAASDVVVAHDALEGRKMFRPWGAVKDYEMPDGVRSAPCPEDYRDHVYQYVDGSYVLTMTHEEIRNWSFLIGAV